MMNPRFDDLSFSIDDFDFDSHSHSPSADPNPALLNQNPFDQSSLDFDLAARSDFPMISIDDLDGELVSPVDESHGGGDSPSSSDQSDSSDPVLKYISAILMEENVQDKLWVYPDAFALQDTERSLYDALGQTYPDSSDQDHYFDVSQFIRSPTPSSNLSGISSSSDQSNGATTLASTYSNGSVDLPLQGDYSQTIGPAVSSFDRVPQLNLDNSAQFHANSITHPVGDVSELVDSSFLAKNIFSDNDSVLQFKRGLEEASKFLPPSAQLIVDFENGISSVPGAKSGTSGLVANDDRRGKEDILGESRGRKNRDGRDIGLEEGRASKQSASYFEPDEAELSDMFDKVLLSMHSCSGGNGQSTDASHINEPQTNASLRESNGGRGRRRRQGNKNSVDLRTLLILCAQALSSNDLRTANELLKQIRQNSSPSGDGTQRLAHYFANGLEARMAGTAEGIRNFCHVMASSRKSVADVLKAYHLHISFCPFKKLSILYMNCMIWNMSQKAKVLHIIDFGIAFGFQWPILIQKLGTQPEGSPKLRITGIEFPLPGFRPAERIEETGQRLARYCERFHVPFEFNALPSANWETIKVEDLKIRSGEMVAVNCLSRFSSLLDETVEEDSPRDAVLNLIRKIKPDVFVHAVTTGSYNAPFFVTRFREALFHLSSIYDMFDATITGEQRNSKEMTVLESQFYGREIMNVVACEGTDRVERPETYKQWQVRHGRAGFKHLPLEQDIMKKIRHKLESWYHKDFVLDEDGSWMLLGWKGRIMYATTCWVPA